jgi:hypothetical protein
MDEVASRYRHRIVLARCDCGTVKGVSVHSLIRGLSKSCGCLSDEAKSKRSLIHGESWHRKRTPEYRSWEAMKARCSNPRNNRWHLYGARGITVCDRWRDSYTAFLVDLGRKPSPKHSLDRIDVNGNYEPENVGGPRKANRSVTGGANALSLARRRCQAPPSAYEHQTN